MPCQAQSSAAPTPSWLLCACLSSPALELFSKVAMSTSSSLDQSWAGMPLPVTFFVEYPSHRIIVGTG